VGVSYDLYFKARSGVVDRAGMLKYFASRRHFKEISSGIVYNNKNTGVYFSMEWREDAKHAYPVAVNINYFKPSFFGVEIEPEISGFVREFDLLVLDPQAGGMGEGEYVPELFLAGWNAGNEFGYASILEDCAAARGVMTLDSSVLLNAWRWNYQRDALSDFLEHAVFVPDVKYLQVDGVSGTCVMWSELYPIVLPQVDYLVVFLDEPVFESASEMKENLILVPRQDLLPLLEIHGFDLLESCRSELPILKRHNLTLSEGVIVLDFDVLPDDLREYMNSLPVTNESIDAFPADKVLDRELFERYAV
jgi:hypothetical protein